MASDQLTREEREAKARGDLVVVDMRRKRRGRKRRGRKAVRRQRRRDLIKSIFAAAREPTVEQQENEVPVAALPSNILELIPAEQRSLVFPLEALDNRQVLMVKRMLGRQPRRSARIFERVQGRRDEMARQQRLQALDALQQRGVTPLQPGQPIPPGFF